MTNAAAHVGNGHQRRTFNCGAGLRRPNEEQVELGLGESGVGDARIPGELCEFGGAQAVDIICGLVGVHRFGFARSPGVRGQGQTRVSTEKAVAGLR